MEAAGARWTKRYGFRALCTPPPCTQALSCQNRTTLLITIPRGSPRCNKLGWCCKLGEGDASIVEVLQGVGRVLAHTFEGIERLGFTASDIGAGLALIRAVQKEEEALVVQTTLRQHITSQVRRGGQEGEVGVCGQGRGDGMCANT